MYMRCASIYRQPQFLVRIDALNSFLTTIKKISHALYMYVLTPKYSVALNSSLRCFSEPIRLVGSNALVSSTVRFFGRDMLQVM